MIITRPVRNTPYPPPSLPVLTEKQIGQLEDIYPSRCMGLSETERTHFLYAGKVELIAQLRAVYENNREPTREEMLEALHGSEDMEVT